jgi:hypothetical protein
VQVLARDLRVNVRLDPDTGLWHHDDVALDAHRFVWAATGLTHYVHAAPGVAGGFADGAWAAGELAIANDVSVGGQVTADHVRLMQDPGGVPAVDTLYPGLVLRAWGAFETDGAGGFSSQDLFGAALAWNGTDVRVNLDHAMASTKYVVIPTYVGVNYRPVASGVNTTHFMLAVCPPGSNVPQDMTDAVYQMGFAVFGSLP